MAKRVLVISQHYWPENFRITDICEGFVQRGIEVDVLCGLPNYPSGVLTPGYEKGKNRRQEKNGVKITRCREILRRGNTGLRIFLNYVSFPFFAGWKVLGFLKNHYDAVFCYETSPVLMIFPAIVYKWLKKVPLTVYVLDLWPENLYSVLDVQNKALRGLAAAVSRWHYRRADKLIAMSDGLRDKLMEITPLPRERVAVIPQYPEAFYEQDLPDPKLQERYAGRFNLVFAGNISPAQHLTLLVECAARMKAEGIDDLRFILVGDGMSRAALEDEIRQRGLGYYFAFPGQVDATEVPRWHTLADGLVACLSGSDSVELTIPAKITSYLAAGRPVVAAIGGEGARVLRQSGCGYVGPAEDVDALYQNLLRLRSDTPECRRQMGCAGRKYHLEHFQREKVLGQLTDFLLNG